MIIEITSSGGFGGLGAVSLSKRVVVPEQSEALQTEYCDAFTADKLQSLADSETASGAADLMRYNIVITDPAMGQHSFDLLESQIPAEMLDLIDRM